MRILIWTIAFLAVLCLGFFAGYSVTKPPTENECLGRIITSSESNATAYDVCPELSPDQQAAVMDKLSAYLRRDV
jgi:hypothetical protein